MQSMLVAAALVLAMPAAGAGDEGAHDPFRTLDWPVAVEQEWRLDTGPIAHGGAAAATVYSGLVRVEGAAWLRVHFGAVRLEAASFLRLSSGADGETQSLDARALAQWGGASAYFNGDAVRIDLVAAPGTTNRLVIERISRQRPQPVGGAGQCGMCGEDDRVPSAEAWSARLMPSGCTASVYSEQSCMVSAGHCIGGGGMTVQFNVPASNGNCSLNQPPVADQFPVIATSASNAGVGDDWSVLATGPNGQGQLPFDRYRALMPLAITPPPVGATGGIWGYGIDETCTLSQTQQTTGGEILSVTSTSLIFEVDIRGGNSGSALVSGGEIVGIVTHCADCCCPNFGTRIDLPAFAIARSVLCGETLAFSFPKGAPDLLVPGRPTEFEVTVGAGGAAPLPGSGVLHVREAGAAIFTAVPMTEAFENSYVATLPGVPCGTLLEFYVTALTDTGSAAAAPPGAFDAPFAAASGERLVPLFADDFEADLGWAVAGTAADGQWQRGVPIRSAVCDRGNPGSDADGSGQCFLTDNSAANQCDSDVDGGTVTLTSPSILLGGGLAVARYWRWHSTGTGDNPFQDTMNVLLSLNGGAFTTLETVGPAGLDVSGGWFQRTRPLPRANLMQLRFAVSDANPPSVVEAAVDGVEILAIDCGPPCPWDCQSVPDGAVAIHDLLLLLAHWGLATPCDFDGGGVGVTDLLALLANWGVCP